MAALMFCYEYVFAFLLKTQREKKGKKRPKARKVQNVHGDLGGGNT